MIKFNNTCKEIPYIVFKDEYNKSAKANQKNIEAICITSYSSESKEVNARFVNLKFINDRQFIFFSNYNSPKSKEFEDHKQITGLIFWSSTNVQIRIKAYIEKTSIEFNKAYFAKRDKKKNALAFSSDQSSYISSYKDVQNNYEKSLKNENLSECPDYWGGYSFTPYYFEFWHGQESRLNKREVYKLQKNGWVLSFIQP
tara:strand:- start:178 stop:774 length:597 start_codon:yes stop_codon:yes gene_type:complete